MQPATPSTRTVTDADAAPATQQTLAQPCACAGIGLHTGQTVQVRLLPAPVDAGRTFVRVDLPGAPTIPAQVAAVDQTLLSTELRQGEATVQTVEHLLAALTGLGVDNVRIELDGPEVPLLDGSAREWVAAIAQAGRQSQGPARPKIQITEPVWVRDGDAFVAALPASTPRFSYGIDFDLAAIGNQWFSWTADPTTFAQEVAPARTFGLLHQIDYLRDRGLIKGGSLDNALVCGPEGWLNPPLRFPNEPVRHKLLDLLGDLSLLGDIPIAHYLAYKASHQLHTQLAHRLASLVATSGASLDGAKDAAAPVTR
jgi:UDP-3-O-[3-hydroxymyristoyl] N-acetylglucosamine deacetylase